MYQRTQVIGDTEQVALNNLATKGFHLDNYGTAGIWIKDVPRPTAGFDHNNWRLTYSQAICLPYNYGRQGDDRHLVITTRVHPSDPRNDETIPVPGADPDGSLWRFKRGWGGAAIGSLWNGKTFLSTYPDTYTQGGLDYLLHEERCTIHDPYANPPAAFNVHSVKSAFGAVPVTGWSWKRIVVDHICRNGEHGTRLRILAPDGPTVFYDSGEVFTAGRNNFVSAYDEGCWNITIADVGYSPSKPQVLVGRAVAFYTDVNAPVDNP